MSALNSDAPGLLYVGGNFTNAGGIADADGIATWNGIAWGALGPPVVSGAEAVTAIAYAAGRVFIGGTFTNAAGNSDADYLAVWDGLTWEPFCDDTDGNPSTATFGGNVNALEVIGNTLWVGGSYVDGAHIAEADGLIACDLSSGVATEAFTNDGEGGGFYALAADTAGNLYGAGTFTSLDGVAGADFVAHRDTGGAWHAMGSGIGPTGGAVNGLTRSLTTKGTDVFIGSDALNINGIAEADHVAKWNGSVWSALGSNNAGNGWFPTTTFINALDASGTVLFASGQFQNANGDPRADHVAGFDGSAWLPVGSDGAGNGPIDGTGAALATFNQGLVMGGSFTSAGGDTQARFVASFGLANLVAVPTPTVTPPPPPAPTPTVTPAPDTTPPAVSVYKLSATVFKPLPSGGSIAAVKFGTTVRYRLSEAARVPFVIDVKSRGRKSGSKCVKPKPSNRRKKACVRYVKVGGFTHAGVKGENQFRFSGRVKRKALKPGNYRLVAVAVDAAGNKSKKLSRPFRIVR